MSELIDTPKNFNELVKNYCRNFRDFKESVNLPEELFEEPDYVMVKANDYKDFEEKVKKIKSRVAGNKIAFLEIDDRFMAVAELAVPHPLGESKFFNLVEIMEPKPSSFKGMEYISFFYSQLNRAEIIIRKKGLEVERSYNDDLNWRWLTIPINDEGQEVRISDKKFLKVLEQELDEGVARII